MLLHIGHGNYVMVNKVLAVLVAEGSAVRRLKSEAKQAGRLVDATVGGRTRSLIVSISGQVILSGVQPETIWKRMQAMSGNTTKRTEGSYLAME